MRFHEIECKLEDVAGKVLRTLTSATNQHRELIKDAIDPRAIFTFWFNEYVLVVNKRDVKKLDYYGGFEYVDEEYRLELGDYVVFSRDSDRVAEVLEILEDHVDPNEG